MKIRLALRILGRESRGAAGRLLFFVICLAIGVAAVVAVAGLAAALDEAIRGESRQLLAADLAIEGQRPLPAEAAAVLAGRSDLAIARVKELATMVSAAGADGEPGRSRLVELKAVEGGYPFYGRLVLDPPRPLAELLGADGAVVQPEVLAQLGLAVGGTLRLGSSAFRIAGVVHSEPDRLGGLFTLGPRVFISQAGLAATGLERFGSRVTHRTLVRLFAGATAQEARALAGALESAMPEAAGARVETFSDAQPALRDGIGRIERFLGLVALLSLLVAGVGAAQTVRAWLAGRLDSIAVLRCLGVRPREVVALYVAQATLLALAGCALGGALGAAFAAAAVPLFGGLLPVAPALWQPAALARGLGLGLGIALAFSLPSLLAAARVPPSRVLRRDAEPLPPSRRAAALAAITVAVAVWAAAALQARSAAWGAAFGAGIAAASAILLLAALALVAAVRRVPRDLAALPLRYGLAALARPGAATVGAILALGLGILVVLGMSLVEGQLAAELSRDPPAGSPDAFLLDVQTDQWPALRALLAAQGATAIDAVPLVAARLTAVDGRGAEELSTDADDDERSWALSREQRLTYLERLPADNRLVAGELWALPGIDEVSVEDDFARDLGADLGSTLTFDIQGVPRTLTVTSLRHVDWRTFGINFFLVAEPGALDDAPQARLAAAHLPAERRQRVQDLLAERFPNVTLVSVRDLLDKVGAVLNRLGLGVRLVGGFTVAAGIAILAGAVSAGAVRRGREVALLKTLGATRRGTIAIYATEYALIGLVAGAIGTAGGALLSWAVLTRGMDLGWDPPLWRLAAAVAASVALTVVAGIAASWSALRRRPVEVLRGR